MSVLSYLSDSWLGFTSPKLTTKPTSRGNGLPMDVGFLFKRFQCKESDAFQIVGEDLEVPPFACSFSSAPGNKHILAVASEDGDIMLLNTHGSVKGNCMTRWSSHKNAVFDICWVEGEMKLLTTSGDQTAALWDLPSCQCITTFQGHTSSVKCADFKPGSKCIFATGSRDGNIILWDARCSAGGSKRQMCTALRNVHDASPVLKGTPRSSKKSCGTNPLNSVTSVIFQDENVLASAGSSDGFIKAWDIRKCHTVQKRETTPVYKLSYCGERSNVHGYTNLIVDHRRSHLFASCTDSVIYRYSYGSPVPHMNAVFYGHSTCTFFIKISLSSDSQYLLSGSSDKKAYLWDVAAPGPPIMSLSGHKEEVTAVSWAADSIMNLVTCGDDEQVLIWRMGPDLDSQPTKPDKDLIVGVAEQICLSNVRSPRCIEMLGTPSTRAVAGRDRLSDKLKLSTSPSAVTPKWPRKLNVPNSSIKMWLTPSSQSPTVLTSSLPERSKRQYGDCSPDLIGSDADMPIGTSPTTICEETLNICALKRRLLDSEDRENLYPTVNTGTPSLARRIPLSPMKLSNGALRRPSSFTRRSLNLEGLTEKPYLPCNAPNLRVTDHCSTLKVCIQQNLTRPADCTVSRTTEVFTADRPKSSKKKRSPLNLKFRQSKGLSNVGGKSLNAMKMKRIDSYFLRTS